MKRYIQKRLLSSIMLLLLASFLIYTFLYTIPGSSMEVLLGDSASHVESSKTGLLTSCFQFLGNILQGDFGTSLINGEKVTTLISSHFYPTFALALITFTILTLIFIPLAIVFGKHDAKACDIYVTLSLSLPSFLLAFILIVLFVLLIPIFPLAGYKSLRNGVGVHLRYLLLPSLTLAITYSGLLVSIVFKKVRDLTTEPPYLYAKARGLKESTLNVKYLFLPTLSVILSVLSQAFISLLSGVAIVETIFNIPGLGSLLVTSVSRRDIPTATTLVLFITVISIVVNFITDVALEWINGGRENA